MDFTDKCSFRCDPKRRHSIKSIFAYAASATLSLLASALINYSIGKDPREAIVMVLAAFISLLLAFSFNPKLRATVLKTINYPVSFSRAEHLANESEWLDN
jgi:hypothetical protein